jgi:crotonobetainyl-CoA:carnitine CoA-transferase CaiB-like acyl-CoA transferase
MSGIFAGLRVIEVATYAFVPAAAAVLAEWGADVVKIEQPEYGDPARNFVTKGVGPGDGGVNFLWEVMNRGKRSMGLDLGSEKGHAILLRMVGQADVFLTNCLAPQRRKLRIDSDDIRATNDRIIYARGSAHGPTGPEADKGGFDSMSYWARTGVGGLAAPIGYDYPIDLPAPGFGDLQSGMNLVGGLSAALYHRERTGAGSIVDVSLMSSGYWAMHAAISGAYAGGLEDLPRTDRTRPGNVLVNTYRTRDGRHIRLAIHEPDRYWPAFCEAVGRPELVDDPRFADSGARLENRSELVALLDATFAEHDVDHWTDRLARQPGQWGIAKTTREATFDEQATTNGYVRWSEFLNGARLPMVPPPVQFDGRRDLPTPKPAPEHAEDTDAVLAELGLSWDEIVELKVSGVVA